VSCGDRALSEETRQVSELPRFISKLSSQAISHHVGGSKTTASIAHSSLLPIFFICEASGYISEGFRQRLRAFCALQHQISTISLHSPSLIPVAFYCFGFSPVLLVAYKNAYNEHIGFIVIAYVGS
jgi:hypothetical protein